MPKEALSQRQAPQSPPNFDRIPTSILESTSKLLKLSREEQNQITQSIRNEDATFANTLLPLAHIENRLNLHTPILTLDQRITSDSALREACSEAQKLFSDYFSDRMRNRDLFKLVDSVLQKNEREDLDAESHRFLMTMHRSFVRNGLNVPIGPEQDRLKELENRIRKLKIEFHRNESNERVYIWLTPQELEGMPQDFILGLETGEGENEGKLQVQIHNPSHTRFFTFAKDGEVRKRLQFANSKNHIRNIDMLKEVVVLRDNIAHLLGYANHATLRLETRMAKTPQIVNNFLAELQSRLADAGKKEIEELKACKKKDMESRQEIFDGCFYPWDYRFYDRQMKKQPQIGNDLKKSEFQDYFPLRETVQGTLETLEELFGLEFRVNNTAESGCWHEDVEIYDVWDEPKESDGSFLGYLYLDLFARDGKDSGPVNFNLQPGFLNKDGSRQYPSTALLCSFPKPTSQTPSLLQHGDVVYLLHELGHCIHNLVSKTTYSRFHGTNAALDFAEAPSQMLENWCWTAGYLKSLGRHYSSLSPEYLALWKAQAPEGEPQPATEIPDDIIDNLIRVKSTNSAIFTLGQVQLGVFDMRIHAPAIDESIEDLDFELEFNRLVEEIQLFDVPKHDSETQSRGIPYVSHILSGDYDVGYYSYLFSEVFALDLYYAAFKLDPMNQQQGRRYRFGILEKGSSQDEMTTLKEFLGREPTVEAFYTELGYA